MKMGVIIESFSEADLMAKNCTFWEAINPLQRIFEFYQ